MFREREPDDRDADLVIGRLLLGKGESAGLEHLERATTAFWSGLPACEIAYDYLMRTNEREAAHEWRLKGEAFMDQHELAHAERSKITRNDDYFLPNTTDQENEDITRQLREIPEITHAWIAQKRVEIGPEIPLIVVIFKSKGFGKAEEIGGYLIENLVLPGHGYILAWAGDDKKLAKQISQLALQLF